MYESDDDTAFTDHLLDQFTAYYTITVVAVHLFMQWKAHHHQTKTREFSASKHRIANMITRYAMADGVSWP